MKTFLNKVLVAYFAMTAGLILLNEPGCAYLWAGQGGTDVYIVHSGKDKEEKSALKKALGGDFKLKFYNVDLLALADYSGKQKAIIKLEKARIVIFIKDAPHELLEGSTLNTKVIIFNSGKDNLKSKVKTLYLLDKTIAPPGGNTVRASSGSDLNKAEAIRNADAVVVDGALDIYKAAALVVAALL